jgi:hypothetical protein
MDNQFLDRHAALAMTGEAPFRLFASNAKQSSTQVSDGPDRRAALAMTKGL